MQEDEKDADWADELDEEQVGVEQLAAQRAPVGKLVANHLVWQVPANEQASEEAAERKHHLPRDEVEEVEQRAFAYFDEVPLAE